jgi:hypothetical protein
VIDSDQGGAKQGYRARGDMENHTKFNDKLNKSIKKKKEVDDVTSKIKNFNPIKKNEKGDFRDK